MPTGTVKFFNMKKGFGFIAPDVPRRGGRDVWVGLTEVRRARLDILLEGQRVEYDLKTDGRGRCDAVNLRVIESVWGRGTVKWFNPIKGYGFIQPQGGGKDVFLHAEVVKRAALCVLPAGLLVEYEIVTKKDGKDIAADLRIIA